MALAVACTPGQARPDTATAQLGHEFVLAGGQSAIVDGAGLRLKFDRVLDDSRCPKRVSCVWTGAARIAVVVTPDGQQPTTLEFDTNPAPGRTHLTDTVGGYIVELRSLDPYPETPGTIALTDYRATMLVAR
ncbi:hypothetical protein [Mycobacterium sp. SM3041]|uniref:hypothetical protein n=1 Tax=Mycobacterium sp. SM3041 TaxID=3114291 RepID=UPI0032049E90